MNKEKDRISILNLSHEDARNFFMCGKNYFTLDIPAYFTFNNLLSKVNSYVDSTAWDINTPTRKCVRMCDLVNHKIITNKDVLYAWRPLVLVHPVLYVLLARKITDENNWMTIRKRFKWFSRNSKIECLSIPIQSKTRDSNKSAQVKEWLEKVEQRSLELSLEYDYVYQIDINHCYTSIYTHSIAWALHGRSCTKRKRRCDTLIGNVIDKYLQDMNSGQTNGIPQGSVLMDFIAEAAIISNMLNNLDENQRNSVIEKIKSRFTKIPNTGHLEIWLQRMTHHYSPKMDYSLPLCKLVSGREEKIWNTDWIQPIDIKDILNTEIIDKNELRKMKPAISSKEVEFFVNYP